MVCGWLRFFFLFVSFCSFLFFFFVSSPFLRHFKMKMMMIVLRTLHLWLNDFHSLEIENILRDNKKKRSETTIFKLLTIYKRKCSSLDGCVQAMIQNEWQCAFKKEIKFHKKKKPIKISNGMEKQAKRRRSRYRWFRIGFRWKPSSSSSSIFENNGHVMCVLELFCTEAYEDTKGAEWYTKKRNINTAHDAGSTSNSKLNQVFHSDSSSFSSKDHLIKRKMFSFAIVVYFKFQLNWI